MYVMSHIKNPAAIFAFYYQFESRRIHFFV